MKVEQNIPRLNYLLELYKLTVNEFIDLASKGLKNKLKQEDLFASKISLNLIKRFDKIFNKGINFYLDPKEPPSDKKASSIFFRKDNFQTELSFGAKQIVNHFEELKNYFSGISKLSEINIDRKLPVYSINQDAREAAVSLRNKLYPVFTTNKKDFLKELISKFSEYNILVFEFVETWNKINRANIDGCFLSPNAIIIKRNQIAFSREIFTLIHELGHYLLNEEEIDDLDISRVANIENLSRVENWCNDFAFFFLAGDHALTIDRLSLANSDNDYHHATIGSISRKTNLSKIALFTRLLLSKKISPLHYNIIKKAFEEDFQKRLEEEQTKQDLEENEQTGKQRGSAPKPIISPLLESTYKTAYYEGIISEYEFCKMIKISPDKLHNYLD